MELPASFEVTRQGTSERYSCQLSWLDNSSASQVVELQEYILKTLANKEFFYPLTPAEFGLILTGEGGLALGAVVEEQLIGFGAVYFPENNDDNLGRDVALCGAELKQVVHLEVCFVHPEYRGNALQTRMSALLLKRVSQLKEYRHLFSTVMPANLPSLISQFKQKMKIVALKQKYNNSWRYIFYRDLWAKEHFVEEEDKRETISVSNLDLPRQLTLLSHGYQGLGYRKTEAGIEILYVRES
ncbi:MAG: GNAT family N-acetyltransferase [Firmicutes bacterium]|nr:GNAT family N-acetyltransferase [Bacillota bacterium]